MNKSRISPDTTAKMMKSDSQDTKTQRKMQEQTMSKNKNACFSCGLCQGSAGSIFESITEARNHVQTVHEIAEESVVDKLIKLPTANFLKSYKCIACPGNAGNLIGVSEETLKTHFKEKHKTNTIKPFLLKRNCRICGFDKAPSDSELVKHFENEHPKSDFWADDEEEPDQDEEAYEPVDDSKYESSEEDRAPSPNRDQENAEEGEIMSEEPSTSKKSKKRKKSLSRSSSRSSSPQKPKQYKDDSASESSSDSDDSVQRKSKKKKKSKK